MAASRKDPIHTFSLGVEEMALALGLINARGLGQALINAVYQDVNADNADIRLTVAGHSLLAHGLCKISKEGTPVLDSLLEQALFPLVRFDRLVQVSLIKKGLLDNASIHIRDGKDFTSHSNQAGIVHVLRHGKSGQLQDYLTDLVSSMAADGKARKTKGKLTPGVISAAFQNSREAGKVSALLAANGWENDLAKALENDLAEETFRAILVRINACQDVSMETLNQSIKPMLVLTSGAQRNWLVQFSSSEDNCEGLAELADRKRVEQVVADFLA